MRVDLIALRRPHAIWTDRARRLESGLFKFEKWVCIIALAVMVASVFVTIIIRNFNLPWPNFGEWALVAMIPLTFVGAAMCTYLGAHISIDAIQLLPSKSIRFIGKLCVAIGNGLFALVFTYSGFFVLQEVWTSGEQMLELGTPLVIPTLFVPLGMMLMLVHIICNLLGLFSASQEYVR